AMAATLQDFAASLIGISRPATPAKLPNTPVAGICPPTGPAAKLGLAQALVNAAISSPEVPGVNVLLGVQRVFAFLGISGPVPACSAARADRDPMPSEPNFRSFHARAGRWGSMKRP